MVVTTKARILIYLRARQPSYIPSTELERVSDEWATKASTIDRRCRELFNEDRIQKKMINGIVWYRLTQVEPRMSTTHANEFLKSLTNEQVGLQI